MRLKQSQALQKGIEAHKAGRVQEADLYYTAILRANSRHPDANHNMGVLAVGVGKVNEALPFLKTALEVNPNIPQFWLSYIDALIKLDHTADAKMLYEEAKDRGISGDILNRIQGRLGLSNKPMAQTSDAHNPPQDELQPLINLYTQGQFEKVLAKALKLITKYSFSVPLYNIIGATKKKLGKPDEAIVLYKKAVAIKPDLAETYYNAANTLRSLGEPNKAIDLYNKALSIKPEFADAYYNIGNTLKDKGILNEATRSYQELLSFKPDYVDAYINMGHVLKGQGELDQAIAAYNEAISIKPDYADAYNNVGAVLFHQGKLQEAIEAYNEAISIKPDFAEAYNNMGNALKDQGNLEKAIKAYNEAISIKPDFTEAYNNMGNSLKGITFKRRNRGLQGIIISILDKKTYARPADIAGAAISLLKVEPILQKQLKMVNSDELDTPPQDVMSDLSKLPLLIKLLKVCPLPDLDIEGLLKNLRASILANISCLKKVPDPLLEFQSALALQCFVNEYIYDQTEDEEKTLKALSKAVKSALEKNQQPTPQVILTLASYKALYEYDWCDSLIITDDIRDVHNRQIGDMQKEKDLKYQVPILQEIANDVSSKVRAQYEERPYTRWVNLSLPLKSASLSKLVNENNLRIYNEKILSVNAPNILIAGCGTGQHSIGTAARFDSSKVLAVDLSLSSLAYAKRKTEEMGIENIEYMQADILDLGELNRKFDIIESTGVLHHMTDPMAGWAVLTDCLKPSGLMKIGLYSESARQHVAETRNEIIQLGIGSSDPETKYFRNMIIKSNKVHHKLLLNSADFYSLSGLRDLLFHVQEHRFTIPQIKDYLGKLGLKFCGFEHREIVSHFKITNTNTEDPYNLEKWHLYEKANQSAFSGMYQFWVQKD